MLKHLDIIKQLTLEEKASLMAGKDFWTTVNIDRLGIPSIFLSDGPHGLRKQALGSDHLGLNKSVPSTCFPTAVTVANSWDVELGYLIGETIAKEAKDQDINVVLGPGTNIKKSPLCGRNFEYFSEDPYLAGKMAASYVKGIQAHGPAACLKHFACNNEEINRQALDSVVDERTLREIYLKQFEIAIKESKPKVIMSSYNLLNGVYTNENQHLLVDILRKEWGFEGVIVSDWGGNNDRVEALKAYSELEMPTTNGDTPIDIVNAVKQGIISEELLDENVDNLLNLIFDVSKYEKEEFTIEEHHKIAQSSAEESIVLLKNDNVLPLNKETKVAFIGDYLFKPRYQGAGSSMVNPTKLDSPIEAINENFINVTGIEKGYKRYGGKSSSLLNKALNIAKNAEAVICYLGLDEISECEGLDRKNISLQQNQIDLIDELSKLNKPIVVVLSAGSAVELPFNDKVSAIVLASLAGQAGAKAITNVLLGKVNPSGKLSESYPLKYEDTISSKLFPSQNRVSLYKEGLYVGYRYYDKINLEVRYPFGHGLSYTSFEYKNLIIREDEIEFEITNTGSIPGKEIAQLYISKPISNIYRPLKELKGFIKTYLEPGETKKVVLKFDEHTFTFFNVTTNSWEIEEGEYKILVGASSRDIRLEGVIYKNGTTSNIKNNGDLPTYLSGNVKDVSNEEFETLLGRKIPSGELEFINKKKNRILVHHNTTVKELKYAKGWLGRLLYYLIKFGIWCANIFGSKESTVTMTMGVLYQPLRGISRMTGGAVNWRQLEGLIDAFNGHFFKGINTFFKQKTKKKKKQKLAN